MIVTYKTRRLVEECIVSTRDGCREAGISYRIIVVDNDSQDGTVEMIREEFPEVVCIANAENLGPAKAYNQGLRVALDSPYVLLLNSDIFVLPGTIQAMHDYLKAHTQVAGVCGDLLFPDGRRQRLRTSIVSLRKRDYAKAFPVTFMGTGFQMTRSGVWRDVGLLDEEYYFYNEDLDWMTRATRHRHRFMFLPTARVIHHLSQGSSQNYGRITQELFRSNLYYFRKHYHPWLAFLAYLVLLWDVRRRLRSLEVKLQAELAKGEELQDQATVQRLSDSIQNLLIARDRMRQFAHSKKP